LSAPQVKRFLEVKQDTAPVRAAAQAVAIDDADIRRGLAADEFYVVFQPNVSLKDRSLWGAEVLVRWKHPRHGFVNPAAFVSIAEQSDTINLLTDVVLREALKGVTLLRSQGHDVHVAVNLSTHSMVRLDLPDRLAETVRQAGM